MTQAENPAALPRVPFSSQPDAYGLYDPRFEHDACGVAFVVDVLGRARRDIVATAAGTAREELYADALAELFALPEPPSHDDH